MDFRSIPPRKRPNQWLICPPGYACREPDEESPIFDVTPDVLRPAWKGVAGAQPRITVLHDDAHGMELVQRTRLLRFADDIAVAYVDLGRGRSSIALWSRSRVGYSDFGANRRRLRAWVEALKSALPVAARPA